MTDGTEKCNPKIEENQREDRRAFRKFIVLLLVSMVVGGITGAFSTMAAKGQADIGAGITAGLQKIAPYANLVIAAALAVWMTGMLRGGRAEYRRWDGEEEQLIEKIERKLGIGVIVTNVALIAGFFFFAAGMKSTGIDSGWEEEVPWVKIAATFLASGSQMNFKIIDTGIMDGFETLTRLGGYIMLFSMIASLLQKLPVPRVVTLILTGMVEITNGIAMLPDSGLPQSVQYVLAVVYTAFGGLSGIAQTSSMIRDTPLSIKRYCIAKLLLAACCGLLACLVSQIFHL